MAKEKIIMVNFIVNEDMTLKECVIDYNDTGLPSDMKLMEGIAKAILTNSEMDKSLNEAKKIIG